LLSRLNQIVAGYRSLNELMNQPVEHSHDNDYISRGRYQGRIEFKNVSFSYPGQTAKALDKVSFVINPGEKVAIVGRVGSGKTTVGKLIAKLFTPDSGVILIDDVDIAQLDPAEIRENIGMVSQEPWMIAGTIEQNILLGSVDANTEDLLWASKVSGVTEFVDSSSKGFKTSVAERGEGLSGGQKQSITIARALVKKPPLFILDEPTSAMDSGTEKKLIDALKKTDIKSTFLVITHRTALLSLVDKVIVFEKGAIVASGSVDGFLQASGLKRPMSIGKDSGVPFRTEEATT
ncbi:MAG: ATP-binding cassette domain-containing protein, partial [Flavobacteriaceae bacterium]